MNIYSFKNYPKYNNLPTSDICTNIYPPDKNNREISVYNFHDTKVTGNSLYYPDVLLYSIDMLFLPLKEKTMSLSKLKSGNKYFDYVSIPHKSIENTPVFFFVYNTDNYYHFIYDCLPYLISYIYLRNIYPGIKLLMNYPNRHMTYFYNYILEFLELLNISLDDVSMLNSKTLYKNIYVSTSYTHDGKSELPPRSEIYDFYKSFVSNCKVNKIFPTKIYISRRTWIHGNTSNIGTDYTTRRVMTNETELVELLSKRGYKEVFTETLTTQEKIIMFSLAQSIVGSIGGGLVNVLFSKPSTQLIVIVSPTFLDINARFQYSLYCVSTIYFTSTSHENSTDEFKLYIRVTTLNNDGNQIVGEIVNIYEDNVMVSYLNDSLVGWNNQLNYTTNLFPKHLVTKLDNGLNSPWVCNLDELEMFV